MIDVPNRIHDGWTECPHCGADAEPIMAVENADRACGVCKARFNGPEPRKVNGEWNTRKWRVYTRSKEMLLEEYGLDTVDELPEEPKKMLEYHRREQ